MAVGLVGLLLAVWRLSARRAWRVRAVVYGWAAFFLYALLCAVILPSSLQGTLDADTLARAFPDGTIAMAALVGGWFWPLVVVAVRIGRERRIGGEHA